MQLIKAIRRLDRSGDTIVEVMLVLAILGMALAISYATANRSLLETRQAEENAQATRYAQSQIESLYGLAGSTNALKPTDPSFNSIIHNYNDDSNANLPGTPSAALNDIYSASSNDVFCMSNQFSPAALSFYDPSSAPNSFYSACTINGLYQVAVYYCDTYIPPAGFSNPCTGNSPNYDTFIVQVSWPDVAGDGTDTVTQAYRIHQGEGA